MSRVLFVTWNGGGNVNPLRALACRLTAGGHGVHVLAEASSRPRWADLASGSGSDDRDGDGDDVGGRIEFLARPDGNPWDPVATAHDVVAVAEPIRPDLVVVDYMMPGALVGAAALGATTAVLVHTLYAALLDGGAPSPMAMAATTDGINEALDAFDLAPVRRLGDLLDRADRVLVSSPRELDAGDAPDLLSGNVRYVGPILEAPPAGDAWVPPVADGAEPLVVVSLGTTPMDEAPTLQRVLDAVGTLDARVVATVGDHLPLASLTPAPNTRLSGLVPHAVVLPHADLVVAHGGLGTVLAALAHGVPLVCVPLGREQPDNAAAVVHVGAGRSVDPDSSTDDIGRAALDVVSDGAYRDAARRMQATIATYADQPLAEVEALL